MFWVFSVWAFCCHMWALHELHNIPNITKIISKIISKMIWKLISRMIWHYRETFPLHKEVVGKKDDLAFSKNISASQKRSGKSCCVWRGPICALLCWFWCPHSKNTPPTHVWTTASPSASLTVPLVGPPLVQVRFGVVLSMIKGRVRHRRSDWLRLWFPSRQEQSLAMFSRIRGVGRRVRPPPRGPSRTTVQRPKGELFGDCALGFVFLVVFVFCFCSVCVWLCDELHGCKKTSQASDPNPQGTCISVYIL